MDDNPTISTADRPLNFTPAHLTPTASRLYVSRAPGTWGTLSDAIGHASAYGYDAVLVDDVRAGTTWVGQALRKVRAA